MTRDELILALVREGSGVARAAATALASGSDFRISASSTPAYELWDVWSWRQQMMEQGGLPQRPGLADAVARLREAGEERVHLGRVSSSDPHFLVFLSGDLQACVACI